MNTTLVIVAIAFILLFVLAIILVLFTLSKSKTSANVKHSGTKKALNLEQMLARLNDPSLNLNALHELALAFINTQKLPFKGKALSADAKKKLDFVTLFALHQNTNAKEISFLNRELSKRYSSYKKEIDAYEQMGLAKRKMRQGA